MSALPEIWRCCKARGGSLQCAIAHNVNSGSSLQGLGGPYPLWIFDRRATQQQRQRSATRRAVFWRAPGGFASQFEALRLPSFVANCQPPASKQRARSLFIRWVLTTTRQL